MDGQGVRLTDKNLTEPVTAELCTYINDKPIVSMYRRFYGSNTKSIDLSSFNLSDNDIVAKDMCYKCKATKGYTKTKNDADILN